MTDRSSEDLRRYLEGELSDEERRAYEQQLLASDEAALDVYDELAVRDALQQAHRVRRRPRRQGIFPARWVVPSAVAAVFVVMAVLWRANAPEGPPVFRSLGPLEAVAPIGEVEVMPQRFVWTKDPDAAQYRFELFDASSLSVVSRVVADTFLSVDLDAPTRGYWTVTSLNDVSLPGRASRPAWYEVVGP